jgi:hypothetical protein
MNAWICRLLQTIGIVILTYIDIYRGSNNLCCDSRIADDCKLLL